MIAFHSFEALRAARYISLLLPVEELSKNQIERIFKIVGEDCTGKMRRISSQFDIFIVYILKRVTKVNQVSLKDFDLEPLSRLIFEQILPSALKIPSPIKGAKIAKILSKNDVSIGEEFFATLHEEIPSRIAKWLAYTMSSNNYEKTIHGKLLFFLDSLKNLCHPSNRGNWSNEIELFLGYICGTITKLSNKRVHRDGEITWLDSINSKFIDEIVEKVWILSEFLLFSKSGPSVSSFTCSNLANLRPSTIIPRIITLVSTSIDSISEPHRTTSAIGLLQVCMPNLLKTPSGIGPVLSLLPTVVFGIDSNDQLKTINTLSLFFNFSETASIIENISLSQLEGDEALQEAKELTGQFPDIFLLFTENIISYLRSISTNEEGKPDDNLHKMIIVITNCVYSHLSKEIMDICLEKWLQLIEEDLNLFLCEGIGEILGEVFKKRFEDSLFDRLILKLIEKISEQIQKGIGQLGSKDQSNKSFNNNLILLSNLLENGKFYSRNNIPKLKDLIDKIMNSITNRKSFVYGSHVAHSIIIGLIHFQMKDAASKSEDFDCWANWIKPKDLQVGKDFSWEGPNESDGLLALEMVKFVSNWTEKQASSVSSKSSNNSKSENEKIYCLLQILDNLNIDLLCVYNSFSSYNYEINSELRNATIMRETCSLLKQNLNVLKALVPVIESIGNLELEIQLIEIVGSVINGFPVNPSRCREKLKALKRNIVNFDRFYKDKCKPKSYWIRLGEVQFKLRRDLRFNLGDSEFENYFMDDFKEFSEMILKFSLKDYHKIRITAQNNLQKYIRKYPNKTEEMLLKVFEIVEKNENVKESEFKGICFLLRDQFFDFIAEDFNLVEKYLRNLLKLSCMPVSENVNDSFEILTGALSEYTDVFVPEAQKDKHIISKLILDLVEIAEENSEKWIRQYLALLSAHPLMEICYCPGIFGKLAKLSLSKVAVIRNISQNCFKSALFSYLKETGNLEYLNHRGTSPLDMVRSNEFSKIPETLIKPNWTSDEKAEFFVFIKDYLNYLCLTSEGGSPDSQNSDSSVKFEYMNFLFIGRWINLMGPEEVEQFLKLVEETFDSVSLDLGKQRAFSEIICALICNTQFYERHRVMKMLRKSWNLLAIEHLSLWTTAIDDNLMWKEEVLIELVDFFSTATETAKIILSIKMINLIFKQIGNHKNWIDSDWLIEKLMKLSSHEYSLIVMESSNLLGTISLRLPEKRKTIVNNLIRSGDSTNRSISRAILQFMAVSSTIPSLSSYWQILESQLGILLKMLQSENVQMLTDAKKAILTLFLAKGAKLNNLNCLTCKIIEFVEETADLPVKISKFCLELVQLLLQNNFALFHEPGAVDSFFECHLDGLISHERVHFRESSHGICLTLYQIDGKKAQREIENITKGLQRMKTGIKSEKGLKERHSIVIRACSIVLSDPRGISRPLPSLLTALSFYVSDRSPLSPLVRTTFSEFRRTHQDTWQIDRQMFDEDQLDAIGELLIAPSYYA